MGITQDECNRRAANDSSRIARRIYHRTLLGLHFCWQWLRRIPSRASTLENLECERFRIERRRRNSLRPTICRNPKSATALHIHRRRLADYGPRPPDTVGRLCQTPAEANGITQTPCKHYFE